MSLSILNLQDKNKLCHYQEANENSIYPKLPPPPICDLTLQTLFMEKGDAIWSKQINL